ncbi:MAG: PH domain-containing protein [Anaerolineales bacterium]|nr:PH domain-containing protein [Anaerolineales bacterium]
MNKPSEFHPSRQKGLILLIAIDIVLAAAASWSFINLGSALVGPDFILYLLVMLSTFAPLPYFIYRTYALIQANYKISRDNLTIRWGLRYEDIPLSDIEWVRPATDLNIPLRLPWLSLPGALLGNCHHPDLGSVEFLASGTRNLLLVATARHIFAISPSDAAGFVRTFQRSIELGSLTPGEGRSVYPTFLIARAWQPPLTRALWISSILLNLALLIWVTLQTPSLQQVSLGYSPSGIPLNPVPAVQLILLPLISTFLSLISWIAGLYLYRDIKYRPLSFALWGTSTLTAIIFLGDVLFIISNSTAA